MTKGSLRWIADRNPFYLLSACFGLTGCWLLADVSQNDLADVAMRIGGLLAYQVPVVALAVWLSKRTGTERDAAVLSVLTLVLAADFSFFNVQAAMLRPTPAILFALFGVAQALTITGALFAGLRLELARPAQWLVALDLAAVYVIPLAVRLSSVNEAMLPLALLAAFSAAGALIAAHAWPSAGFPGGLGIVAPVVALSSLLVHMIAIEWVFRIPFFAVFLSPLCLGAASVSLRRESTMWCSSFSVLAVFLALQNPPPGVIWVSEASSWLAVSPLRLTAAAAAALLVAHWTIHRDRRSLLPAGASASLAALGHTAEAIRMHAAALFRSFPTSRAGWGALLFVFAFLLLAAGAWISWWKTRESEPD